MTWKPLPRGTMLLGTLLAGDSGEWVGLCRHCRRFGLASFVPTCGRVIGGRISNGAQLPTYCYGRLQSVETTLSQAALVAAFRVGGHEAVDAMLAQEARDAVPQR